jgi:hypothetical protein
MSERTNAFKSMAEEMKGRSNSGELGVEVRMTLLLAERA